MRATLIGMTILLLGQVAHAVSVTSLNRSITEFNAHARYPVPTLNTAQYKDLLRGEVLRLMTPARPPDRLTGALGLMISEVERDRLWYAARDPHHENGADLHEHRLGPAQPGTELWCGLLKLPWPFAARRWLVNSSNNLTMAQATAGRAWERHFELVQNAAAQARRCLAAVGPDMSAEKYEQAVLLPVNRGAWLGVVLEDGRSLLGYQVTVDVGGVIPPALVRTFSTARLESLLRDIERIARSVRGSDGAPPFGGDGRPLSSAAVRGSNLKKP